jgi:hypothetical protein
MADAYLKVKDNGAKGLALARETKEEAENNLGITELKTQLEDTNETASNAYVSGNSIGTVITVNDAQDASPVKSAIIDIVPKQDGTGTPSSENVRSIIGYDGIDVYCTGKNIWGGLVLAEAFNGKTTGYTIDTTAKTFTYVRRGTSGQYATVISSGFKPNTRYTILITASASARNTSLLVEYTDGSTKTTIDIDQTAKKTYRFVTNANKTVNRIMLGYVTTGTVTVYYDETGIFEGEISADDFEQYNGKVVGHTLDSTIYGGKLNLLTGELEKISGYIASYNGETLVGPWISSIDVYAEGTTPTAGAQVFDFGASKNSSNLTPKSFTMIGEECNVWANCGSMRIEYLKNTKEYIKAEDNILYEKVISEIKPTVVDNIQLNDSLSATSHDVYSILDDIPSYWKNPEDAPTTYAEAIGYLEQKIETIPVGKHFLFVTDAHVEGNLNAGHSNFLMNYIKKRIGANKVLFGGDAVAQAQNKYYYAKKLSEYLFEARRMFGSSYLPTYGDHDTNLGNSIVTEENKSAMYLPYSEGYKIFFGDLKGVYHWMDVVDKFNDFLADYAIPYTESDYNDVIGFFKSVYYLDDDIDKIRYITLNCGQASAHYGGVYNIFGVEQIDVLRIQFDWFVDVLKSVPAGYDVVVLSHKASNMNSTAGNIINKMLSYYKQKGSYQPWPPEVGTNVDKWWYYKTIYDFSDAPDVGIVLQICGHRHFDMLRYTGMDSEDETTMVLSGEVENGGTLNQSQEYGQILQITTQTDSCGSVDSPDAYPMTLGTTTEQCFDVVTICPDKVVMTRIGAGVDMVVNITFAT